jgi:hypothetical protein
MSWTVTVQALSYAAGAVAAVFSTVNYWRNIKLERSKWVSALYTKFFEQQQLRSVRECLDCRSESEDVAKLLKDEPAELTEYLNFFEFVAYLRKSKQISKEDVTALFEYYLKCLSRHPCLRSYIKQKQNGYQYLDAFLEE